jgi:hypothetical protein
MHGRKRQGKEAVFVHIPGRATPITHKAIGFCPQCGKLQLASPQRAGRGPECSQATPLRVRDPGSVLRALSEESYVRDTECHSR